MLKGLQKSPARRNSGIIYRSLKNLTNKKLKSAEALHYKNLIESAADLKERWRSLNSVVGSKKDCGWPLQVQDGKRPLY